MCTEEKDRLGGRKEDKLVKRRNVKRLVEKAENLCLRIITGLAIVILMIVTGTFGISDVPGLFQLAVGTLAAAWITVFALANIEE